MIHSIRNIASLGSWFFEGKGGGRRERVLIPRKRVSWIPCTWILLFCKTEQLSAQGWMSVPLFDLRIVPCSLWFLWGRSSPQWESCFSAQVLTCLLFISFRLWSCFILVSFPAIFVHVCSWFSWRWGWLEYWADELCLINWARLCRIHFNWQHNQQMNLLAIFFPSFRWVKCQPHAGSHVQRICSCFPLLLLFYCRVLQANSIWRGYFLLPEKCLILLPCFLTFPLSLILISQIQSLWEIRQYEIWKLLG